jgi:hypothetical protein
MRSATTAKFREIDDRIRLNEEASDDAERRWREQSLTR